MPDDLLTVRCAGTDDGVSAEGFLDVLRDTLATLQEIDRQASSFGATTLDWLVIDAGLRSPLFAKLRPRPLTGPPTQHGNRVVTAFVSGIALLSSEKLAPDLFTGTSLRLVAGLVQAYAKGLTSIEFALNASIVPVNKVIARNAHEAAARLDLDRSRRAGQRLEYGTIEGQLNELASQPNRDKLVIVDSLTRHETRCYISDPRLEQKARDYWKHRVAVSGKITSDRLTGDPSEMQVDEICVLRNRSQLPQIADIAGIDITGGIESSQYVANLRDGN
jgi:hypothetical protein